MIASNTDFKNEYYIPHAKPSITSDVTSVSSVMDDFIREYVREAIILCLGERLGERFIFELSTDVPLPANLLKPTADPKWDKLLNGETYTNGDGDSVTWRGMRFKEFNSDVYKNIFTPYVFYQYEKNAHIFRGGAANAIPDVKNATVVSAGPKVINAMRKFIDFVQSRNATPNIIDKGGLIGVDWYSSFGGNKEICLYRYINEKNELDPTTFEDFNPKSWDFRTNQYGI